MATVLNGTLTVALDFLSSLTSLTPGATTTDVLAQGDGGISILNGSGDNMANKLYYTTGTLTATTITYDLTSLAGTYGTITFTKVKALYLLNKSATDGLILSVGNAATNPWSAPWSASTTVEKVMPGSPMLKSNLLTQGTNPWTVDGTHSQLKLDSGASTIPFTLVLIGV